MAMPTARTAGDGVCDTTPPDQSKRTVILLRPNDASPAIELSSERSFYNGEVPRVSAEHLTARRQQILDAARVCFLRNGFHQTSMQDVIKEANLSVGAVYRYFPSKNDLIIALAEQVIEPDHRHVRRARGIGSAAARWPPRCSARPTSSPRRPDRTGCCGWRCRSGARRCTTRRLAAFVARCTAGSARSSSGSPNGPSRRGTLPADTDPEAVGVVLFALMPGYALQRILTGGPEPEVFKAGLRTILPAGTMG